MLNLFKDTRRSLVQDLIDKDGSIVADGTHNTVVMYTFLIKTKSREVLVYQRPDTYYYENFRNLYSIGFGGGIEVEDILRDNSGNIAKFETIIQSGLREVDEELIYHGDPWAVEDVTYVGMISDTQVALVCAIEVDDNIEITVAEPENIHVGWIPLDELTTKRNLMEPWSRYIVDDFLRHFDSMVSMESANEQWVPIPGYSKYVASRTGKIKNLTTGRISKGGKAGRYLKVSVYPDGQSEPHLEYLHILICKAFHGPGKGGQIVKHKNNMRFDCRASNLEWSSQSENIQEAYDDGLIPGKGANYSAENNKSDDRYFHISFDKTLEGVWNPNRPDGYWDESDSNDTSDKSWPYPEPSFPRISVSTSLEGCFRGVYPNVYQYFEVEKYPFMLFNIYEAVYTGKEKILTTDQLTKDRMVWDAHVTKECCFLSPVKMKLVGELKVLNSNKSKTLMIHPFNDKRLPKESAGPIDIKYSIKWADNRNYTAESSTANLLLGILENRMGRYEQANN